MCNCDGVCACKPGLSGPNCEVRTDCGNLTDCLTCLAREDCGWCDEAKVCENKYELVKCSEFNKETNPRGFFLTTDPAECPVADAIEEDVLSDNRADLLIAALVGSLGVAAMALAAMAYFLRTPPVEALGADVTLPESGMFNDSSIYVPATQTGANAGFV